MLTTPYGGWNQHEVNGIRSRFGYSDDLGSVPNWDALMLETYLPTNDSRPVPLSLPTISGSLVQGQVVTASAGVWGNAPYSFAYQWRSCDVNGETCANASGSDATTPTYTIAAADVGKTLRVQVTTMNDTGIASAVGDQTSGVTTTGAAAPAFRSATSFQASATTSLSITKPAGAAAGDVFVASIAIKNPTTITPPPGWSLVRSDTQGTMTMETYTHAANGAEPANYRWRFATSTNASGGILAVTGANINNPVNAQNGQVGNCTCATVTAPTITTTVTNTLVVLTYGSSFTGAWGPPATTLERWDVTTAANTNSGSATKTQAAAGATGAFNATHANAVNNKDWIGHNIAIRP
jgi:hypothetical protein